MFVDLPQLEFVRYLSLLDSGGGRPLEHHCQLLSHDARIAMGRNSLALAVAPGYSCADSSH